MVPGNYFTLLQWSAQSPDHSLIKHFWDEVKWDVHSIRTIEKLQKLSCQVSIDQNPYGTFLAPCSINASKNFWVF